MACAASPDISDELLSILAHEIRAPLTSIKGCARTLLRHEAALDATARRQFLRDIDDEAERLHRLVENILQLFRAGPSAMLQREPVAVEALVRRVVADVSAGIDDRRFRVRVSPLPPALLDASRIEHVFRNLLDNAVKYSPPKSRIAVAAHTEADTIVVEVSNEGEGIAPECQARIFERFDRIADPATHASGSGLGLAVCRGVVEGHAGHIEVHSAPGRGATFRVILPIDPGAAA